MLIDKSLIEKDVNKVHEIDNEDQDIPAVLVRREHEIFAERIRKSLYYGKFPTEDRPSLPMTEIAVNYIRDAAPKELGKIDMYLASDIGRRAYVSPCSMMLGMIYIERLKHKNPDYLTQVSSSDLFLISMMVASKYLYDEGTDEEVYNDEWAEAADVETDEVNMAEMQFLRAIDWSLFTQAEDFERLLASMEERTAFTQGHRRKFWTYGDMAVLLSNARLLALMRQVVHEACKVVLVCSIAYTAGVVTMAASMTTMSLLRAHSPLTIVTTTPSNPPLMNAPELTATIDNEELVDETTGEMAAEQNATDIGEEVDHAESHFVSNSLRPAAEFNEKPTVSMDYLAAAPELNETEDWNMADQETHGLSFPGFLTLAFFKDTVSNILHRLNTDDVADFPADEISASDSLSSKCTCPNCPLNDAGRRKTTIPFGHSIPPLSICSSLKSSGRKRIRTSQIDIELMCRAKMSCNLQGARCGKSGTNMNKINDQSGKLEGGGDGERLAGCGMFQCAARVSPQEGSLRIHEGLAPDLLLGFHTTNFANQAVLVS